MTSAAIINPATDGTNAQLAGAKAFPFFSESQS